MSKLEFVVVGDMHICADIQCPSGRKKETFYEEQKGKLQFINDYCKAQGIKDIITTGDILNYKNPSLYTANGINALIRTFGILSDECRVYTVAGNHDLKASSREMKSGSVYNILSKVGVFEDLHGRVFNISDIVELEDNQGQIANLTHALRLSGIDFTPDKELLHSELAELNKVFEGDNTTNIAVVHEHLLPEGETLPFGDFISYNEFKQYQNIDILIAGHLHKGVPTQTLEREGKPLVVINPWALTRLARDNYALDGSHKPEIVHVTVDQGVITYKHVEIPHKPFKEAFNLTDLKEEVKGALDISEFVSTLTTFTTEAETLDIGDVKEEIKSRIIQYLEQAEVD